MTDQEAPSPDAIARQFGAQARLYAVSKLHREGATLALCSSACSR